MATGWGSLNAHAYIKGANALGAGELGKALGAHHLEPRDFLYLYKSAHLGSMVDKSNKYADTVCAPLTKPPFPP